MGATELLLLTASILGADDVTMIQFSADWCGHCKAMAPTVDRLERSGYPIVRIDSDTHKELIGKHRVRALPTFILMRGGRELSRLEGEVGFDRLAGMFEEAGYRGGSTRAVRGQSPPEEPKGILSQALERFTQAPAENAAPAAQPPQPALKTPDIPTPSSRFNVAATTPAAKSASSSEEIEARAMSASVKLRIEDADGFSFGSGTIIDTHGEDALILTCGHIFRDSNGKGVIEVQISTNDGPKTVAGHLLDWEPDYHDVGLVAIRPGVKVAKAQVASGVEFKPHDTVFSIGCDRGDDPSLRRGRISALNKFQGAPNIEVTGKPTLGRSGGGLFDRNGQLIGVCKLANPTDNEGIYASIESIHHHLDKTGLRHVYQSQQTKQLVAASEPAPKGLKVKPASLNDAIRTATSVTPVSNVRQGSGLQVDADSEVIVIVRSKSNPQAKSQVMVVDDANEELLQAIHRAVNRHRNPAAVAEAIQTNDRRTR